MHVQVWNYSQAILTFWFLHTDQRMNLVRITTNQDHSISPSQTNNNSNLRIVMENSEEQLTSSIGIQSFPCALAVSWIRLRNCELLIDLGDFQQWCTWKTNIVRIIFLYDLIHSAGKAILSSNLQTRMVYTASRILFSFGLAQCHIAEAVHSQMQVVDQLFSVNEYIYF